MRVHASRKRDDLSILTDDLDDEDLDSEGLDDDEADGLEKIIGKFLPQVMMLT